MRILATTLAATLVLGAPGHARKPGDGRAPPARSWLGSQPPAPAPAPPPAVNPGTGGAGLTMQTMGVGQPEGFAAYEVVAFSPDGRQTARWASDRTTIELHDTFFSLRGKPLRGHTRRLTALRYEPSGDFLVSGDAGGGLRRWRVEDGAELARGHGLETPATDLAPLPDGSGVLVADAAAGVVLLHRWEHPGEGPELEVSEVRTVHVAPSGEAVLVGTAQGYLLAELGPAGLRARVRREVPGGVSGAAFSLDGRQLALGSPAGPAQLLARVEETWEPVARLEGAAVHGPTGVAFSPSGTRLVVGDADEAGRVRVLRVADRRALRHFSTFALGPTALTFCGHDEAIAYASGPVKGLGGNYLGGGRR